ncbi:MAG: YbjN domain-containing protein [Rhodoplanes sp.]
MSPLITGPRRSSQAQRTFNGHRHDFSSCSLASCRRPDADLARFQPLPDRVTPEQVASILKDAGYRAEILADKSPQRIRTGIGGRTVLVALYDCQTKGCSSLQFYAGFRKGPKFNLEYVNEWNSLRRYGKAYLDKDGDLAFEFDVDLDGGVGAHDIQEKIFLFERLLSELEKFDAKQSGGKAEKN